MDAYFCSSKSFWDTNCLASAISASNAFSFELLLLPDSSYSSSGEPLFFKFIFFAEVEEISISSLVIDLVADLFELLNDFDFWDRLSDLFELLPFPSISFSMVI